MATETEELRKIRRRLEGMNPPSVGCGVFVGLWLFLGSLLLLRVWLGIDALAPLRGPKVPAAQSPATTAAQDDTPADGERPNPLSER